MKDESQLDTLIETIYTNVRNRKKKFINCHWRGIEKT